MTIASGFGLAIIFVLIILGMIVCTPERLLNWSAGIHRTGTDNFGPRSDTPGGREVRGIDAGGYFRV